MIEFIQAIQSAGLTPPEHIETGRFNRFPGAGKRSSNRAGWCTLFDDGQGGAYGDYSTGLSETWQAKRERPFSNQEKEEFRKQLEASKRQAEDQRLQDQQRAAAKAGPILEAATGDPANHPYIVKKKQRPNDRIKRGPWPQRGWSDAVLVPIIDENGKMTSVQAINTDGSKDFLRGGKKKGCFRPLGKFRGTTGKVLVGEGWATVAAAVEATGFPGVVAFDAGNLIHVAEVVRRLAPDAEIFILADDDQKPGDPFNPGIVAATNAAKAVAGKVALPSMGKKADFWDLWNEQGVDAVRQAIEAAAPVGDQQGVQCSCSSAPGTEQRAEHLQAELTAIIAGGGQLTSSTWCGKLRAAKLTPHAEEMIIDMLVAGGVGPKRVLRNEYKVFRETASAEEAQQKFEKIVGGRRQVRYSPLEMNRVVEETEQGVVDVPGRWTFFSFGGPLAYSTYDAPARISTGKGDQKPPEIPVIRLYTANNLQLRIEQSVLHFEIEERDHGEVKKPIPTPQHVAVKMLDHPTPKAPRVSGLVSTPIITPDGEIISSEGIDPATGLLLQFGGASFTVPSNPSLEDARGAVARIKETLFDEYSFRETPDHGDLYRTAAVAMLLTGVFRKTMDQAPGGIIQANVQGSGKTSLGRSIHIVLTGRDMPVSTLNSNADEFNKSMLAMLMESPSMICFDNVADGFEISDPTLAKAITAPYFKGRVLGRSQEIVVPTNTLFVITGNNVTLSADLVRRFLSIQLTVDTARPEQRSFKHPDVFQYTLNHRAQVVHDCLTITKAYADAGCTLSSKGFPSSGFGLWDRMVRLPLLWACGVDVLATFELNREQSTEEQAMVGIMECLWSMYQGVGFTASEVLRELQREGLGDYGKEAVDYLRESVALMTPKALDNTRSLSWVLKKMLGRIIGGRVMRYVANSSGNYGQYLIQGGSVGSSITSKDDPPF